MRIVDALSTDIESCRLARGQQFPLIALWQERSLETLPRRQAKRGGAV